MKKVLFLCLSMLFAFSMHAQIYTSKEGSTQISFFSEAPLENIEALNKSAIIVFKSTGEIQVSITMLNFKFKNALMEEHFNGNYIESENYPKCIFKGKFTDGLDLSKDGTTQVTCSGKLELHGVTKDVTMFGTITKTGNELKLNTVFMIRVADYNIKVPSMYVKNIAEEVKVTFETALVPYVKNK